VTWWLKYIGIDDSVLILFSPLMSLNVSAENRRNMSAIGSVSLTWRSLHVYHRKSAGFYEVTMCLEHPIA